MSDGIHYDLATSQMLWHDDVRRPPKCQRCSGRGSYMGGSATEISYRDCVDCGGWGTPWLWVRTNEHAQDYLEFRNLEDNRPLIKVISLDHDLGGEGQDPDAEDAWLYRGDSPNGTGLDLVDWMIQNDCVPDTVFIHSMSAPGADSMQRTLKNAVARELITNRPRIFRIIYTPE